ncbi:MAG: hypothetical protein JRK53_22460 [Deltaproteobacteria bacterium]|nr:hypothetical protein [Deltaproteobacteria bacterium]
MRVSNVGTIRWTVTLMRTFSRLLKLYILFFLVAFGLSFIKNVDQYPVLPKIIEIQEAIQRPTLDLLKRNIPLQYTQFKGRDITPAYLFAFFMAFWILLDARLIRLQLKESEYKYKDWDAKKKRAEKELSYRPEDLDSAPEVNFSSGVGGAASIAREPEPINEPVKKAASPAPKAEKAGEGKKQKLDREKLLEIYARTRRALDDQKRDVSFLSIDVVDSTGMKKGEEQEVAERDFRQYRKFVQKIIEDHGALKAAWTPDGVMICFPTVKDAVKAAKRVIKGLVDFNSKVKSIQRDFTVRTGINSGSILFDETVPMEEMSDRTIDIAGHMQKYAGPDTIYISKPSMEALDGDYGFTAIDKNIDGREVYAWRKN